MDGYRGFRLPTLASVKAFVKQVKAERKEDGLTINLPIPLRPGRRFAPGERSVPDRPTGDPARRQECLARPSPTVCPIYVSTGTGDAILLPIRKSSK